MVMCETGAAAGLEFDAVQCEIEKAAECANYRMLTIHVWINEPAEASQPEPSAEVPRS